MNILYVTLSLVGVVSAIAVGFMTIGGYAVFPPKLEMPEAPNSIEELEPYLQNAVDEGQPPGISLIVSRGAGPLYSRSFGFADRFRNRAVTDQTVYQWWSITKTFTAVAVLQLQEKGLLALDDPVSRYLEYFEVQGPQNDNQITVRQLLSHSSGLGDIGMAILGWIHFENEPEISQTSLLKSQLPNFNKLEYAPGEEGRYSNLGYVVLAGLIEAVSQQTYQSYIVENILRPLRMERTDFVYTDMMKEDEATGSHPKDIMGAVAPFFIDMNKAVRENCDGKMWFNRLYSNQKGSTGLIGSAKDMGRFMQAVLNEGELDGIRILSAENIQLMQRPIVDIARSGAPNAQNQSFGLGWFVDQSGGETILSHAGAGMALVAMMKIYPEKDLGVAVFANSTYLGRTMGDDLTRLVAEIDWR